MDRTVIRTPPNVRTALPRRSFIEGTLATLFLTACRGDGSGSGLLSQGDGPDPCSPELFPAGSDDPDTAGLFYNEVPWLPAPEVLAAYEKSKDLIPRYAPDELLAQLPMALAGYIGGGVNADNVIVGAGSSEWLNIAMTQLEIAQGVVLTALPTYDLHLNAARALGIPIKALSLDANHRMPMDELLTTAKKFSPLFKHVLIYLSNPNNPTGTYLENLDLSQLPDNARVIVDEAYYEIAKGAPGYQSMASLAVTNPKVIVTRTFSKVFSMASLRIGYAVAHKDVAQEMVARQPFDSVARVSRSCALAALEPNAVLYMERVASLLNEAREAFIQQAQSLGCEVIPSVTNFAMLRSPLTVPETQRILKKNGVRVARQFASSFTPAANDPYRNMIRVTMGTKEEMIKFWDRFRRFVLKRWANACKCRRSNTATPRRCQEREVVHGQR